MCQEMLTQHSKNPVSATTKAVAKNGDSMHALVECDQKQTIFSSQTSVDAKSAVLSGSLIKPQASSKLQNFFSMSYAQPKGAPSVSHSVVKLANGVEYDLVCADIKTVAATSPAPPSPSSTIVKPPLLRLSPIPETVVDSVPESADEKSTIVKTLDAFRDFSEQMGVIDDSDDALPSAMEIAYWLVVIPCVLVTIASVYCYVVGVHDQIPFPNLDFLRTATTLSEWKALPLHIQQVHMLFMGTISNTKLLWYRLDMQSRLARLSDIMMNHPHQLVQRVVLESSWCDIVPSFSILIALWCIKKCQSGVYLIDFCVYESPEENKGKYTTFSFFIFPLVSL